MPDKSIDYVPLKCDVCGKVVSMTAGWWRNQSCPDWRSGCPGILVDAGTFDSGKTQPPDSK